MFNRERILSEINALQLSPKNRDKFYRAVFTDLYGGMFCAERFLEYFPESEIELQSYYSELLWWYRKILEHLYFVILIEDESHDKENQDDYFKLYILARELDGFRRGIKSHKDDFGIEYEKNLYHKQFSLLEVQIHDISWWRGLLWNIISSDFNQNNHTFKSLITNTIFIRLEKIHHNAFEVATYHEKKYLGSYSWECLYWILSEKVHASPILDNAKLELRRQYKLFVQYMFYGIIECINCRYAEGKLDTGEKDEKFLELFGYNLNVWEIKNFQSWQITDKFCVDVITEMHDEKIIHFKNEKTQEIIKVPATIARTP